MNSFPGGSPKAGGALGPAERDASLAVLRGTTDPGKELDILIVGGGIVGTGAALDAVTRGLSVGIVEANDWAAGTSSRSSKLIHGGLRYLEMLDFALVKEALHERGLILSALAPHLARPVPSCTRSPSPSSNGPTWAPASPCTTPCPSPPASAAACRSTST